MAVLIMAAQNEKSIQEQLSLPILLADRVLKSTQESNSSKLDNPDIVRQVTQLSQLLRSVARLTTTNASLYDRPIRRVAAEITKTLDRALTLVRKCTHKKINVLRHVLSITTSADCKKVSTLLESSLADIKWVLSIYSQDSDNGMPPIASNDPMLAWVWSYIASVQMGRAEAAYELANLTRDNDRCKKIIVEESGIPPLLKLLKENGNLDAQNAVASVLCNLADNKECVNVIVNAGGISVITKAVTEAALRTQITLVNLISRMSEVDLNVRDEFGRENVTRPLVSLLGMDVNLEDFKNPQIDKHVMKNSIGGNCNSSKSKREAESQEMKLKLKVSCANALSKLARGSVSNSKKITETKALLVLAKIIEKERGDLQINCLKAVMELASVAELNSDLRRAAFKLSSPAAKSVLDQILRVISEETNENLVTPAIKAIGCLASMFPAKETRIIERLVAQLGHRSTDTATEVAKALGKFVRDDNFNRKEHSKAIIEFNGVFKLMNVLRSNDRGIHLPELVLLCYLAINIGNDKSLEKARALSVLEGSARHVISQYPDLRELFGKAIHQLTLYQPGAHTHRHIGAVIMTV